MSGWPNRIAHRWNHILEDFEDRNQVPSLLAPMLQIFYDLSGFAVQPNLQDDNKCDNGHAEMHTYVPPSPAPTLQILYDLPGFAVEPRLQDDNKCDNGHTEMHTYRIIGGWSADRQRMVGGWSADEQQTVRGSSAD
ncbi:hypothetical protein B0H17DRAFT_1126916 [Mycena rosella]|uniref:Uncharacterized protein n=1 Tax=Mycena rosella TaxID=1033263 RepID=A0AAD7GT70_MYCRO|nr:hypothetical protein B0H17DRAFT_1126916 [Mycena rosella]